MPKITKGGVSDVRVDEDYIAPPGHDPAAALETGVPDAGAPADGEEEKEGSSSRGKTSSSDSKKPTLSTQKQSDGGPSQQTAQSTTGRSKSQRMAGGTASSADTK